MMRIIVKRFWQLRHHHHRHQQQQQLSHFRRSHQTSLIARSISSGRKLQGNRTSIGMSGPLKTDSNLPQTEEQWKLRLTPEQFRILRKKGTEMAGTGEYNKHQPDHGIYECAGCSAPLYRFDHKFDSGCGWPAFFDAFPGAVSRHEDRSFGRIRTEITCTNCGGHLGHVFKGEGFGHSTDERHCVNSISIRFNNSLPVDIPSNSKS